MAPAVDKKQENVDAKKKDAKGDKGKTDKKEEPELVGI